MAAKEPSEEKARTLDPDTNKSITSSRPSVQPRSGGESKQKITASILVAEDTPTSQLLIETLLKNIGCEVVIAQDGAEALEKIKLQDFDLVIMDIRMPNMSGYEATERMRKEGYTLPIVALTAYASADDREKCLNAGCDDYLSKPLDQKKLGEIIRKYVTCHDNCATSGKSS
ncbi:MAG: response regulator [Planctomycetota bacterium]|jgi:CheY-like chemotaxis protein